MQHYIRPRLFKSGIKRLTALSLVFVLFALLFGIQIVKANPLPAPKMIADASVGCAYNPQEAKILNAPICADPPEMVADTLPGTAGSPSPQVITVQGCSGCVSTGGGGGSGSFPYGASFGQTNTSASYVGTAGYDYANGNTDAILVAPFGGNAGGTGYPASYNQPGVQVVQGGLQGGAIAISGNLGGPYSGTSNGQTATTGSFMGTGGLYNTSLPTLTNTQFSPFQLDSSSRLIVNCATGCSGSTTYPYSGTSNGQTATTASFLGSGGLYNSSPPTLTNTQFSPLQLDSSGNLNVNVKAGSGSTVFPYSGTTSGQTATSASFLGAAGVYNTSLPTLTNTQAAPIQLDSSGRQIVNVGAGTVAATQSGTWNIGTITTLPSIPAGANTIGAVTQASGPWTNNVTQFGSSNVVTGTGASGAGIPRVTVSNDSTVISQVQSYTGVPTLTPTVQNAAYGAGNDMGGLLSFTSALRSTDYNGILESIQISSKTTTTSGMSMCFFNANPTSSTFTDKSAPSINAADNAKLLGCQTLGNPLSILGTGTSWSLNGIGMMVNNTASATTLYGVLLTTAGYTPGGTTDLTITLGILQD